MAVLTHEGNVIGKSSANDGVLTIQKNNVTLDTFSANSASNKTVNIEVPTKLSDLTDDVVSGNYVKTSNSSAQTVAITTTGNTTVMNMKSGNDTESRIMFSNASGTTLGFIGANSSNKPVFSPGSGTYELAQVKDVIKTSNNGVQTITNTSTSTSVVLAIRSSYAAENIAGLTFQKADGSELGYIGYVDNKLISSTNGVRYEIALVKNTPIEVPMTYALDSDTLPNVIKKWLQYICKNYPGLAYKTFVGTISFMGAYKVSAIIYNTDTHDSDYTPQYAWGEMQLMTTMYIFSCNSYTITTKQVQLMS